MTFYKVIQVTIQEQIEDHDARVLRGSHGG